MGASRGGWRSLGIALAVPQRNWPCKSNPVRLGSSPRASTRVGGLRAFGRGSGHRASPNQSTPLSRSWQTGHQAPRTDPAGALHGACRRRGGRRSPSQVPAAPSLTPTRTAPTSAIQPQAALRVVDLPLTHKWARGDASYRPFYRRKLSLMSVCASRLGFSERFPITAYAASPSYLWAAKRRTSKRCSTRVTESFRTSKGVRTSSPRRFGTPAEPWKRGCENSAWIR